MRMTSSKRRRVGAVLPLVTICLIALFGFVALAIDVGMMALARTQAQAAADISALAGARTLDGQPGNNKPNAELEAKEAAKANYILGSQVTDSQIVLTQAGVYKYDTAAQRFAADFVNPPSGVEAYGAMQVRITTEQATYFGRVLGVNSMTVSAQATAVHRPRDIAISLDFSGSMKYSSEFNYPPISGSMPLSGGLNPDDRFPRFGPWKIYPVASTGNPNPMHRLDAYIDIGGETHAANNMTIATANGPAIVANFQTTAANNGPNAFVYNGDLTAGSFNLTNTPVCTPTPGSWSSQYASGYAGDRWPLKWGVSTTSPAIGHYASTAAEMLNVGGFGVTTSTRDANWETNGYDYASLNFTNGAFKGYSMGPGYYGKSFYIWPPDPRYANGANPTSINASNPAKDSSDNWIADWRKRFFLNPSSSAAAKGTPLSDNSRLFTSTGVWQSQNLGGTLRYVPNYDAILAWIKNGPKTLPPSLRAGRVKYYGSIPDSIPVNWQTGIIGSTATDDQRFWKSYIDFVIGCGEHNRAQTLYGYDSDNSWGGNTFGTGKITPASMLTGTIKPYMAYDDCPVHPRLNMWFGPLTMLGFLSVNSNNLDYNWFAGTTYEAQTWQLKAGIQSALDDIKRNHPNDLAALSFWSSFDGYNSPRVAMGKDYDKMKHCLFYPFSLVSSLGTVSNEKVPYTSATPGTSNPSGLDYTNYESDIPLGAGGTNPTMGLMLSYNQFNWTGGYTGRKGAAKIVILETDGVANQKCNGTLSAITGGGGAKQWTNITNGGTASYPSNGNPQATDPAITAAWIVCQDSTGSKPWPNLPAYTAVTGLPGTTPTKYTGWSGASSTAPGFSTNRSPVRIHTLAFGYMFEDNATVGLRTRALEFLRNIQVTSGLPADSTTGTIESYKKIIGTYDQRIAKIKEAMERIMQSGIQVALIE